MRDCRENVNNKEEKYPLSSFSLHYHAQGSHEINLSGIEGPHCGLVPVGAPADKVSTAGLKWNLDMQCMQYGGLISTCNLFADDVLATSRKISVSTTHPLFWYSEIESQP